jgi:hypothetical protein
VSDTPKVMTTLIPFFLVSVLLVTLKCCCGVSLQSCPLGVVLVVGHHDCRIAVTLVICLLHLMSA